MLMNNVQERTKNMTQGRAELINHIQQNLITLISSCRSVADMCRKIDINRQQFNKYLAGQHIPSQKVLQKIARYFMIEAKDLLINPNDFKYLYEGLENEIPTTVRYSRQFNDFLQIARATPELMEEYLGVYYRYHYSSIYKGKILRSITYLYRKDALVQYVTIEHFPDLNNCKKNAFKFRYDGFCFMLGGRIFMVDMEEKQYNEMTFSILTTQHRYPIRFLYGILSGIASTSFRQPFATKMSFQLIDHGPLKKHHIQNATILDINDESIPFEIKEYLLEDSSKTLWGGA
ncbi:helix-turn-helix domain-containing protein [Acinetobacter sp. ANC 4558]|uniref:helix-turn-helix domain-containing protein n=1 Tax=Acinetobacter sp. ANC 4558 TaxID=1977876 RepID=UPI001D177485|nr:helix-turn-helix transcriptional regulator [Acinetobacter sp. ANC 4558]